MRAQKSKATNPWDAIDALVKTEPEPTGPEWFTIKQYTARYGGNIQHNQRKLRDDFRFEMWTDPARRKPSKYRIKQ